METTGRAIVGIGDLVVVRGPQGERIGGLAADVARHAVRLGHRGIAIGRVGQDDAGERIRAALAADGVDVEHVQADPDLPTGRVTLRVAGGSVQRVLDPRCAFDNLQWDFDLEDIAPRVDAVIFGGLARRNSQTRNTIDRFLALCSGAWPVFDLVHDAGPFDRPMITRALELAQGVMLDRGALDHLAGSSASDGLEGALSTVAKRHRLSFVMLVGDESRIRLSAAGQFHSAEARADAEGSSAALIGFLHGALAGWEWPRAVAAAARYAEFDAAHPGQDVPRTLLDAS
jgi:fructokinase